MLLTAYRSCGNLISDKIKQYFFLNCSTKQTLTKHREKNGRWELDKNATRCFKQILKATPPPPKKPNSFIITYTDHLTSNPRRTKHVEHRCWCKEKLTKEFFFVDSDTDSPVLAEQQRLTRNQHCADTESSLEDLPGVMDDGDGWRERERGRERERVSTSWWRWWWWCFRHSYSISLNWCFTVSLINKYTLTIFGCIANFLLKQRHQIIFSLFQLNTEETDRLLIYHKFLLLRTSAT